MTIKRILESSRNDGFQPSNLKTTAAQAVAPWESLLVQSQRFTCGDQVNPDFVLANRRLLLTKQLRENDVNDASRSVFRDSRYCAA
jgi:hypothetical protein